MGMDMNFKSLIDFLNFFKDQDTCRLPSTR